MRYLSVCSGIEAASVAWHPLGWKPVAFSEIEAFPSAVLAHRFPDITNLGDMTAYAAWPLQSGGVDLLVGGTPCQSFSVAGLRKGLADPRGNLALVYLGIASRLRPRWIVWENVPGVLSSGGGRDFGAFLGALGQLGYGWAYRTLDAQWFGVAQRRRRVFVVAHLGDWRRAAAVLFEPTSLLRNPPSRGEARQATPSDAARCFAGSRESAVAATLETTCNDYSRADGFNMVAQAYSPHGHYRYEASEQSATLQDRENRQSGSTHLVAQAFRKSKRAQTETDDESWVDDGIANTLNGFDTGDTRTTHAVAFHPTQDPISDVERTHALGCGSKQGCATVAFATPMVVRRLTPVECERLQGFPDGWTDIPYRGKPAPDGPRYKALGNSMAVPVMRWIGQRIAAVELLH